MATKILICVSADQATVGLWKSRRLTGCKAFDNDEAGWSAFNSYLLAARGSTAHVMADTVDEDYRFETLPHAKGGERAEMVARKLRQLYRGTTYFSHSLQSRELDKRKDDRYLFAALTSPELLSPWLKAINAQALPVAGVYSLPMVSASLITHLKEKHPNLLVVSKGSAGVRQTFFKDLKFRISRLTPLRELDDAADQYYADEVGNTRMYLDALTITHVDDALQVVILDQDDSLAGLPAAISRGRPNMRCTRLGRSEIVSRFSIAPEQLEASNDALHLHLLGEGTPALNFAPPQVTQGYQRYRGRRMVYAAAGATLLLALLWSGKNVLDTMSAGDETVTLRRQTQDLQARYQKVQSEFPEAPTTSENLRNAVEVAEQLKRSQRMPDVMMSVVSNALGAAPQIQLASLEWKYEPVTETTAGAAPVAPLGTLLQSAFIRGEVGSFSGDYKNAMTQINAFATSLASDARVARVQVLKLPFNASSDAGMSGNTNVPAGSTGAQFEFAITFKAGA
jgi:hypothetical protein